MKGIPWIELVTVRLSGRVDVGINARLHKVTGISTLPIADVLQMDQNLKPLIASWC